MNKRTRQELRRRCPTPEETDALLDMADERDRYRALLIAANGAVNVVREIGSPNQQDMAKGVAARIDAALEGNNDD